jgi:tetratricopeptide (TPR) repeat protein
MNFRNRAVMAFGALLFVSGCASSGGTQSGLESSIFAFAGEDDDLPQWVQDLPEGIEPRDNDFTARTALFLAQGRLDDALQTAEAGIAADPDNPQSFYQAGDALVAMGRLEEGAARLDRAEALYPRYILETIGIRENAWLEEYNDGIERLNAGDLDAALAAFSRGNAVYAFRPEGFLNAAAVQAQLGDYAGSATSFGKALEVLRGPWMDRVDPETRQAWEGMLEPAQSNMGRLYLQLGDYDAAVAAFQGLARDYPENMEYQTSLASSLVSAGRGEEASDLMAGLLRRTDLSVTEYFNIGVGMYQTEQYESAAQAFQRVVDVIPGHREAAFNLAQALYLAESWEALAQATEGLVEIDALNPLVYQFRANALLRVGTEAAAMEVYTTGQDLPFVMDELGLQLSGNDLVLVGAVANVAGAPNATVRLRFTFFAADGSEAGTSDVSVSFQNQGEARGFEARTPTSGFVGYSYRVLN